MNPSGPGGFFFFLRPLARMNREQQQHIDRQGGFYLEDFLLSIQYSHLLWVCLGCGLLRVLLVVSLNLEICAFLLSFPKLNGVQVF